MPEGGSSTAITSSRCAYCDAYHAAACPRVESIEYYANGAVKKVTLRPPLIREALDA